jgi:zinc protease
MRETASELSLTREAVESERAVVLAEARLYDTPAQHEFLRQIGFLYRGQPIGDHMPIGDMAALQHFTAEDLRAFYRAYYRPERATLIVVGAIDPAEMEKQIRARFGDWQGQGEPGSDPERQPPRQRGPEVATHIEPQAPGLLLAQWVQPYKDGIDDRRIETENVTRALAMSAVNRAYDEAAHSGKVPFSSANLAYGEVSRSADIAQLSVGLTNLGDWKKGAGAVYGLMRQTLATGLSQEDLDRQIAIYRAAHDKALEGAATRETRDLAEGLMSSVDNGTVFRAPATDKAIFEQAVATVTPAKADAALKALFEQGGPLFFVAGVNLPNDLAGLPDLWAHAAAPVTDKSGSPTPWPYDHIGDPGKVMAKSADPALGVTHIGFENGVALAIRPSKASAGQILVSAHLDLPAWNRPPAVTPPYWSCSPLILGGVNKLPYADLGDFLHRSATAINCSADPRGVMLSLAAQPDHLDAALQALAAYIGDPAWRPEAMAQTHDHFYAVALQYDSTLEGRLERDGPVLFHDGDERWRAVPKPTDLPGMALDQAKAYLAPALADAPLSVVVAGDVDAERATQAVAATLGALPKRKDAKTAPPPAGTVKFPAPNASPKVLKGPRIKDQALALMAWPTHDAITELDTVYELEIASAVLQRRLFDKFRTELGATYTPAADHSGDLDLPGSGVFYVDAIAPPDKLPLFYQTVNAILADLRTQEVGADEFERARKPLLDGQIKAEQSNAYWAGWLEGPTREAYARSRAAGLKRATPKGMQQAIRTYLLDSTAWKAEIRPEG